MQSRQTTMSLPRVINYTLSQDSNYKEYFLAKDIWEKQISQNLEAEAHHFSELTSDKICTLGFTASHSTIVFISLRIGAWWPSSSRIRA